MLPSSKTMLLLCDVFGVDISYFLSERRICLQTEPVFRKGGKEKKPGARETSAVLTQVEEKLNPYIEVLTIFGKENEYKKNIPLKRRVTDHASIEMLAENVRAAWNLGTAPVFNLVDTAEKNGFHIISITKPPKSGVQYDAVSFLDESFGPVIALCEKRTASRKRERFTLAHELGHYFISNKELEHAEGKGVEESRANTFAAALLMPEKEFREDVGTRTNFALDELYMFSRKYGVSVPDILFRLNNLGIISEEKKAQLKTMYELHSGEEKWHEFRYADRDYEKPLLMKQYVYQAVIKGFITWDKGEELLGTSLDLTTLSGDRR